MVGAIPQKVMGMILNGRINILVHFISVHWALCIPLGCRKGGDYFMKVPLMPGISCNKDGLIYSYRTVNNHK